MNHSPSQQTLKPSHQRTNQPGPKPRLARRYLQARTIRNSSCLRQFQCECGEKAVEIPAIKQLMSLIARNLAMKNESLTGLEIKFLRKQLGQKANDFAEHIKLQPETLSRIENEKQSVGEKTDVYIRIYYALESKDPVLMDTLKSALDRVLSVHRTKPPKKPPKTVATIEHDKWALAAGAGR